MKTLLGLRPPARKCRQVRDFVMYGPMTTKDTSALRVGDIELSVADRKIPLDKVSQPQFMEGSLRILPEMVQEDNSPIEDVINYVGYLIKVSCIAQSFTWSSVLNFDAEYRRNQSSMGYA